MKIGVSSYSYSRYQMEPVEVARKAKSMGFDYIEFFELPFLPSGQTYASYAPLLRQECEKLNIKIVNYAVSADLINNDLEKEIERLKGQVDIAHALGAPLMRHDATSGFPKGYKGAKSFEDALPVLIKGYRSVTEYAAQYGIKTMIENHGFFSQDSERVEKLINGVNNENFGLLLDMGNFLCVDENPVEAVGRLLPYVFHVHAKDFHVKSGMLPNPGEGWFQSRGGNYLRGSIIGHGEVPVFQCLNLLKKSGYDGVVCVEFEGLEEPTTGISIGAKNLQNYINLCC